MGPLIALLVSNNFDNSSSSSNNNSNSSSSNNNSNNINNNNYNSSSNNNNNPISNNNNSSSSSNSNNKNPKLNVVIVIKTFSGNIWNSRAQPTVNRVPTSCRKANSKSRLPVMLRNATAVVAPCSVV